MVNKILDRFTIFALLFMVVGALVVNKLWGSPIFELFLGAYVVIYAICAVFIGAYEVNNS